jgi:Undecaprenyl-phosphate glucose phosphotransferase
MLKEKRQFFEVIFVVTDLLVIALAWVFAYWIRFEADIIAVEKGVPPFENYFSALLIVWLIWVAVFRRVGLYKPMRGIRRTRELWLLLHGNSLAILLFMAVIYLFREKSVPFSRLVFVYFWVLVTLFTIVQRSFLRFLLREIRRQGYNLRYMLLVGGGQVASDIVQRVRMHRELGVQVVGCLTREGDQQRGPLGIPVVGAYRDLREILTRLTVDQVVISLPLEDHHLLPTVMSDARDTLADIKIVPDVYQFISLAGGIEEFEGLPVLNVQTTPLEGVALFVKRCFDFILSIFLSIFFLPLMFLIAFLIKLTSRGPVLYSQERVSVDGTKFSIFKFRTMTSDAEQQGPGWTKPGDMRVTRLGKILRSTSLDELPQIFNVMRGDMSFVGPRPERPFFIEEFRHRIPRYMLRHKVPAGMTGWAQVNGWRGDTSIDRRIECDLYYITNWSLLLDLKILCLTLVCGFRNRNAY